VRDWITPAVSVVSFRGENAMQRARFGLLADQAWTEHAGLDGGYREAPGARGCGFPIAPVAM